jgi:hypothetical protein
MRPSLAKERKSAPAGPSTGTAGADFCVFA